MKTRLKLLMLFTIIIINMLIVNVYSLEPEDLSGFLPDIDTLTENATITSEYSKYPWTRYGFDIEKGGGFLDFNAILNILPSIFFAPLVLISKFSILLLVSCYKLNIYNIMPEAINRIVEAIRAGTFEGFYEAVVCFAGVYGMYLSYKGKKTNGLKVSASTIIVFFLSTWFFVNPSLFATNVNKAAEIISVNVLLNTTKAVGIVSPEQYNIVNADDSVVLLGNLFWNMSVQKPWELIQYGSINEQDPDEFLKHQVGSDQRKELANTYAESNSFFRFAGLSGRIALALIMFILGLVYNLCIGAIALTIAYNHLASLFWLCFAGVFFLAALYPKNGLGVLANWAIEAFGYALNRIIIVIALSIYFGISITLYSMAGDYGYFWVIAMNIVTLVIAMKNYKKVYMLLLGLFTANEAQVNKGMQKQSIGSSLGKAVLTAYAGQKLMSNIKQNREQNKYKNFERKNQGKAENVLTQKYMADKNVARNNAKNKLSDRYRNEKLEADKRAKDTNRRPEYSRFVLEADKRVKNGSPRWTEEQIQANTVESDFVKQVDYRKEKGFTLFSDDQVKSTVNQMYKLKQEGNNPDRLLFTDIEGMSDEEIRASQKGEDRETKYAKTYLNWEKTANNNKIEDNIEAYPEGHFQLKSFAKSYGRKGKAILGQAVKGQIDTIKNAMSTPIQAAPSTTIEKQDIESIESIENSNVINLNERLNEIKDTKGTSEAVQNEPTTTVTEESKQVKETTKTKKIINKEKNIEQTENIKEHTAETKEVKLNTNKNKIETVNKSDNEVTTKNVQQKRELKISESSNELANKHIEVSKTHNQREVNNTISESIKVNTNFEQPVVQNHTGEKPQISAAEIAMGAAMIMNKGKSNNQSTKKSYKKLNLTNAETAVSGGLEDNNG